MRPARPPPPKTKPQKWEPPPKKRKTIAIKKSVSREREQTKSVWRQEPPKDWITDNKEAGTTDQRVDDRDTHDEVEQQDEQDSGSLEDKNVGKVQVNPSESPSREIAPELTNQGAEHYNEDEEEKMCNAKLTLCTNINTTDISDITENALTAGISPLSKIFC